MKYFQDLRETLKPSGSRIRKSIAKLTSREHTFGKKHASTDDDLSSSSEAEKRAGEKYLKDIRKTLQQLRRHEYKNQNKNVVKEDTILVELLEDCISVLDYLNEQNDAEAYELLDTCLVAINEHIELEEECLSEEEIDSLLILQSIIESYYNNTNVEYTFINGDKIIITPEIAEAVVYIHDNLDEENQDVLIQNLSESADDFNIMMSITDTLLNEEQQIDETHYGRKNVSADDVELALRNKFVQKRNRGNVTGRSLRPWKAVQRAAKNITKHIDKHGRNRLANREKLKGIKKQVDKIAGIKEEIGASRSSAAKSMNHGSPVWLRAGKYKFRKWHSQLGKTHKQYDNIVKKANKPEDKSRIERKRLNATNKLHDKFYR